jgi:membrane protease YdiL (CAAX protease family)
VTEDAEKLPFSGRIVALFEVLLCSDYPTQLAIGATLYALGVSSKSASGGLSLRYIVLLSLIDTAVLLGLIVLFLKSHRERVRTVIFGPRSWVPEAKLGLPLAIGALVLAIAVISAVRLLVPALHNLDRNPLQDVIRGPRNAVLFGLVVIVAGGIREEIQRAFILHRFDVWLGGPTTGLIVSSAAFGLGHVVQGHDVAIATGMLGFYWGAAYLRRRSCIAPMISHAAFNVIELLQYFAIGR